MIMSPIKAPEEMTALKQRILEVVQDASGAWLKRSEIGDRLGRKRINPYDIAILEELAREGRIEATDRTIGTVKTERIYRSIQQ